jgi:hypothetical protein
VTSEIELLLVRAEAEARGRGDSVWGSGEMLLALIDAPPNAATAALAQLGLTKAAALATLSQFEPAEAGPLSRSNEIEYFLELADRVAYARGDGTTGLDHVLLGMLWERDSAASKMCDAQGIAYEDCYRALYGELPPKGLTPPPYVDPNLGESVQIATADLPAVLAHLKAVLPPGYRNGFNYEGENNERAWIAADARVDLPALIEEALGDRDGRDP